MARWFIAGVAALFLATGTAFAQTTTVEGKVIVSILESSNGKCDGDGDMAITVKGAPAAKLLQMLKQRVRRSKAYTEIGLTIYETKDRLFYCDETEKNKPMCQIWFTLSKVKIVPAPVCE